MREILFRGKRVNTGEWAEGYLQQTNFKDAEVSLICDPLYEFTSYGNATRCTVSSVGIVVIPETVGQYTGLTDKYGKKIFEGDVVRLDEDVKRAFRVDDGVVRYGRGGFHVGGFELLHSLNAIASFDWVLRGEVIGNIHDNPELLKGE